MTPDSMEPDLAFATPIFARVLSDCDELNQSLAMLFREREHWEGQTLGQYSSVGGWHSPIDLQRSANRNVQRLLEHCTELARQATGRLLDPDDSIERYDFAISAWANISRAGDYNVPHVHETAWSVVYYVQVPAGCNDTGAGCLELIDPRPASAAPDIPGRFFATRRMFVPRPGLMVLFPGPVMHFVHPFRGEGERISVACDIEVERRGGRQ